MPKPAVGPPQYSYLDLRHQQSKSNAICRACGDGVAVKGQAPHSTSIFAFLITFAHRLTSSRTTSLNCCGVLPFASRPNAARRSITSGSLRIAEICRFIFVMIAIGVPEGAKMP